MFVGKNRRPVYPLQVFVWQPLGGCAHFCSYSALACIALLDCLYGCLDTVFAGSDPIRGYTLDTLTVI